MVWDCADSIQSGQRGAAGVVSAPKGSPQAFREELEGTVRIGDREVAFTRYFDAGGCAWVEYGDGPGYLFHYPRKSLRYQWSVRFDYGGAVIAKALSRRKNRWQEFYYQVEVVNKLLANDSAQRVAGDLSCHVIAIRRAVIAAVRNLDSEPLRKLADAVDAVKYVATRTQEDERMLLAIVKAAKAQGGVPYRAELQPYFIGERQATDATGAW